MSAESTHCRRCCGVSSPQATPRQRSSRPTATSQQSEQSRGFSSCWTLSDMKHTVQSAFQLPAAVRACSVSACETAPLHPDRRLIAM